ncbi:MAG TPA: hypothetical protein VJR92_12180 [Gemmatimonadaceae bacterium]|nr:hypothetical protein [Gemmatimonadaceae bacterium]
MSLTVHRVARRAILAASLAVVAVAPQALAQGDRVMETGRTPRRYIYPFIGAAVGGLASLVYFWSGPRSLPGACASGTCVAAMSLGSGAFVGWLVGRERDQLHALRYRGGIALYPNSVGVNLTGDPMLLTVNDSIIAASGNGGVQLVANTRSDPKVLATRGAGLRGINDAAMVASASELVLTSTGGVYRFPLLTGMGVQVRGAPAAAVVVLGTDYVVASGNRVERIPRSVTEMGATYRGVTLGDSVRALELDSRGVVWAVTANQLYSLKTDFDSLSVAGSLALPRGAQRLAVEGNLAAVALGDSGLRFVNVADAAAPATIADWHGTKFVYDVALLKGIAYTASGIDGMAKVSLRNGTQPMQEGLARELGFIVSIAAANDMLWVLDRSGTAVLRRLPPP